MRKELLLLIATSLVLQACSVMDFIQVPTIPDTPTSTLTPTASNTPTITLTPTRTTTPTPRNTATLIISNYDTPVVLVTKKGPTQAGFAPTSIAPTGGFESVELTKGLIYYGACDQTMTKMTVKVEHPEDVRRVYIFFRLESGKKPGDTTPWTGSSTYNDGGGYFLYTLRANQIPERRNFIKAWVHYQFVAENAEEEIIGRTQVFTRNLILEPCK